MKVRESGMPEARLWHTFFDPETILNTMGLTSNVRDAVDFGCGYGTFAIPAAKRIQGTLHGFDIKPAMIEACRRLAEQVNVRKVRLYLRDFLADGTGLDAASVDYVMLFNILHAEDPLRLLREAWRILSPGGRVALIHWNYDPETPRGPPMAMRPRPEDCRRWITEARFQIEKAHIDLQPYHYGIVVRKVVIKANIDPRKSPPSSSPLSPYPIIRAKLIQMIRNAKSNMKAAPCRRFARKMFGASCLTITLLLGWDAPAASAAKATLEVREGESAAEVIDRLGRPQGMLAQGRRLTYLYDRGLIDFVDGRVVKAALVSPEEAVRLVQQRQREAEENRRRAEAARLLAASEAQAELQKHLADDKFAKSPPADRLAYWMDFSARYPDVDVRDQIARAQEAAQAQRRQAERQKELMALKGRVVEIQERFKQLDADYAASLAHWKRNEITAERAKLTLELDAAQSRIRELAGPAPAAENTKTAPGASM